MPRLARSFAFGAWILGLTCVLRVGGGVALGGETQGPFLIFPSASVASRVMPERVAVAPPVNTFEANLPEGNGQETLARNARLQQEPATAALGGQPTQTAMTGSGVLQGDGATRSNLGQTGVEQAEAEEVDEAAVSDALEKPRVRRELSPGMIALRDQVRRTLAAHQAQVLSTADNNVTEVLYVCRGFGHHAEVLEAVTLRKKLNAITCLTWNYPCQGFAAIGMSDGHLAGRVGYGYQEYPGELVAALALARVPSSYPARVGDDVRTVADLVEYEKLACREGTDKSLVLIGLACYTGKGATWRNRLGEEWSVERILKEELEQPVVGAPWGGTQRLMGLGYAVRRQKERKLPMEGHYARARDYIARFHEHALALQNENGSWSEQYLAARGAGRDPAAVLASTGRILEWLAFTLPEERLEEPGMVRAVHFVNQMLSTGRYSQNVKALRTEEIGAVMHALAGLRYYDDRCFKAADPPAGPPAVQPVPAAPAAAAPTGAVPSAARPVRVGPSR